MTTIKVTTEQLISVSKKFELAQQTAMQMNSQLLQHISFMERFWDGITKEQFYYRFQTSQKNMTDFVTLTDSIAKELRHHADKFRLADTEQGDMVGVIGSFPVLAGITGIMNAKRTEQSKPAYDYDEYDKKLVGNMWILSKNGVTDQEAAKATLAYNDALKNGDIKLDNESEDVDINLVQIEAFKQGYNPWTGEKLPEWHAKSLIVSSVFSSFMGIRSLSGGRVKINKGYKIKSGSNIIPKADFKNLIKVTTETAPSKPGNLQENVTKRSGNEKLTLSDKARELNKKGHYSQALDIHYEDMIRKKTGGKEVLYGEKGKERELDSVTDRAVIEAKRSMSAITKPDNFINKKMKQQLKATLQYAEEHGLRVEYWFKYGVHPKVKKYLEEKGIIVKTGLGD